MSDTTDVKVLTLNQKTVFNTSAAIERIKLHNNSSFFLRVYYGADAPTDPASGAGWHDTIDPGGTPLLEVVGNSAQTFQNRSYIQSTPYLGVITVMPFLPVGALAAAGGVITGLALCYLTAYYAGEWAQEGGEIEAYVQAAKQGRYQSVDGAVPPTSGILSIDETYAPANAQQGARIATFNPTVAPNLYAANASVVVGSVPIQCYLYALYITLRARTPAVARASFAPFLRVFDTTGATGHGAGTNLLNAPYTLTLQAADFGVDRYILAPSKPLLVSVGVTNNTLASGDVLWLGSSSAWILVGAFELDVVAIIGVDLVNVMPLTALAGFNQLNVSSSPVVAPSTFNPETY